MIDFEHKTVTSRQIKPAQRRALKRIVRFVRDHQAFGGVTSVRFELTDCDYFVAVVIKTRRSDCGKYSPRAILCEFRSQIFIGPRGGLTVKSADSGLRSCAPHVRRMLHAK